MWQIIHRIEDSLCSLFGIDIRFDGDLLTPRSPDDPWWYNEPAWSRPAQRSGEDRSYEATQPGPASQRPRLAASPNR